MKLILALLLSGVAYTIASPPICSEHPDKQCGVIEESRFEEEGFIGSEEFVDLFCDQQFCRTVYEDACGTSFIPNLGKAFKVARKVYNALCKRHSPIRQKYFENAKCLIQQAKNVDSVCSYPDESEHPDICPKMKAFYDCARKVFLDCGKDAGDVYDALVPGLDYYGC